MTNQQAARRNIAILVADGFDEAQVSGAKGELERAGATVHIVSPTTGSNGRVRSGAFSGAAVAIPVDVPIDSAVFSDYDALILPGGDQSVRYLRSHAPSVEFVKSFFSAGRPVAAINGAIIVLAETNILGGRRVACAPTIQTVLSESGAEVVNKPVVIDDCLITGRSRED